MANEINNVYDGDVVSTVDVTSETSLDEDVKSEFGAKDCGVVLGIAIAGIAAYEGVRHGVKAVKEHTIPWFKAKFGKNKTEATEPADQESKDKPEVAPVEAAAEPPKTDEKSESKKGNKK